MDDRVASLERRLEALTHTCEGLQERLSALEARLGERAPALETPEEAVSETAPVEVEGEPVAAPRAARGESPGALVGRSFVVLGGAFYLRSLTDGGTLSPSIGVALGLLYAAAWYLMAERASLGGRRLSALLHALTATAVAFPLIWEASRVFQVLGGWPMAGVLLVFTAMGLVVAWLGAQLSIAWVTLAASLLVGVGLLFATRDAGPLFLHLEITAVASVWLAHRRDWGGLPWFGAILVDGLIAAMTVAMLTEPPPWLSAEGVMAAQLGLLGLFVGTFGVRHLVRERPPWAFDAVQLMVAFGLGFEGAARLGLERGLGVVFGAGALVGAGAVYGLALVRVAPRQGRGPTYYLWTSLGALAFVDGLRYLPFEEAQSVLLAAAAVAAVWLGRRADTAIFRLHAAVFAVTAGALAGLWSAAADAFFGHPESVWRPFRWAAALTVVAAVAAFALAKRSRPSGIALWAGRVPELALLLTAIVGIGAVLVKLLAGPLATVGHPAADGGALAVLRTAVLSAAVMGLTLAPRRLVGQRLRYLITPLLVLGLLKLVIEDLPRGRPGTLFLSLVFLGTALIVATGKSARAARERRRRETAETADTAVETAPPGEVVGDDNGVGLPGSTPGEPAVVNATIDVEVEGERA